MRTEPNEPPSFDHLIHWVTDLDKAADAYRAIGLPVVDALTMPGFRNAAWPLDLIHYVELATVTDWEAVTTSKYAEALEALRPAIEALDGSSGGLTFAVHVPDASKMAEQLRAEGHEIAETQVYFEEYDLAFTEVFVCDGPTWWPFFISFDPPRDVLAKKRADAQTEAEKPGTLEAGLPQSDTDLEGIVITSADPETAADGVADLLGLPIERADGAMWVPLPDLPLFFERGETEGITTLLVSGIEIEHEVDLHGLRLRKTERENPAPLNANVAQAKGLSTRR
ncbi:MAG: VOC family protein [Pseudomonadota bacterium]